LIQDSNIEILDARQNRIICYDLTLALAEQSPPEEHPA
jgi:hypothetical protein